MIQTDPNPKDQNSIQVHTAAAAPTPKVEPPHTDTKTKTFSTPPTPPAGGVKKPTIILLTVLFIAALVGGLLAYQNFSKSNSVDLTQKDDTLAWRPFSIVGTCSGVKVVGYVEKVSYSYTVTFVLNQGDRSASVTHTFKSKPVSNGHKIDEDVLWSALGADGVAFGNLVKTNDQINWSVVVDYTLNNKPIQEQYADIFIVHDESCSTISTPAPTATPAVTTAPTATVRATATPRVTATPVATATPRVTATPVPTDPPVGGPSSTPVPTTTPVVTNTPAPTTAPTSNPTSAPTSNPTSAPTTAAQATSAPENKAVAQTQTEQLPAAGIPNGLVFMIAGVVSIIISGVFAFSRKRFD